MGSDSVFRNPYTPGAGHPPPYLAGRELEQEQFNRLLDQDTVIDNMVLTGLRGVGKTVLLERFKARALESGWLWAGNDLSESASITEQNLAIRLMTDLSIAAAGVTIPVATKPIGYRSTQPSFDTILLSFEGLSEVYNSTPGLVADRLKAVFDFTWQFLKSHPRHKLIFAYDESQNLADHAEKDEFPLSVLLDVFQSIQRKGIPFLLLLTGLPTLSPKLVEARTFTERMFRVVMLGRLDRQESMDAVTKPIEKVNSPVSFNESSVDMIVREAAGYPYFIQFICREVFDIFIQQQIQHGAPSSVPFDSIQRKLDSDFFSARGAKVTDRQRDLLWIISCLATADEEFTIQEIVEESKDGKVKPFSSSQTNQMLLSLSQQGLIYKNRFGKYSFAVPLLGDYIARTHQPGTP